MALIYPDTADHTTDAEPYEALKTIMNTTFKDVMDTFSGDAHWNDRSKCLVFKIDDVKWYESYPDVQRFKAMMNTFHDGGDTFHDGGDDDEIPGYCTEFVRIGEDYDDVETEQTGDHVVHFLSVRREIECDV
jgi:hypothetical protein